MPSSIPYDPRLVLTSVVNNDAIANLEQMALDQAPADAAQQDLNSLLSLRHSLDMTITEITNLPGPTPDTSALEKEIATVTAEIVSKAIDYAKAKITAEKSIQSLRAKVPNVNVDVESPVDYLQTQFKSLPLAAESMNMDVQYFSYDGETQNAISFASSISGFVANTSSALGQSAQNQMSGAAFTQASLQTKTHSIAGTLVISVTCTHKMASVLAPFILNVDKGIKVWNYMFPNDLLEPTNTASMLKLMQLPEDPKQKFSIISGTTFGSSFVGMVHVLNTQSTKVGESLSTLAASLQDKIDGGLWLASEEGDFGVNETIGDDIKSLLSSQSINSHVTLISMGVIPSMVASSVKYGVDQFAKFDPASSLDAIATLQNATNAEQNSVKQSADASRMGKQMLSMKASDIKSSLSALVAADDGANKILDINSMMTALDDYLKKATAGQAGIPINYYLKDITKLMLAEMWVNKYMPEKYLDISNDDSKTAGTKDAGASSDAGDAGNANSGQAGGGDNSGGSNGDAGAGTGGDAGAGSGGDAGAGTDGDAGAGSGGNTGSS